MSAVPRAVQLQADQAAMIEQAIAAEAAAPAPDLSNLVAAPAEPPPPDPDAPPAPPAEPSPPPPAPPAARDDWEHKYKTLQGVYRSDVVQTRQLIDQLAAELKELKRKPAEPPAPAAKPAADPKDVETFGADLVEMVQRVAERMFGATVTAYDQRLSQVESTLGALREQVGMSSDQVFWSTFKQLVPDWEQVNASEQFLGWLAETDPVYGQPRQAALDSAQQALDAPRAAAVFNAWKALQKPAPTPSPRPSLNSQVAPNASASAPVPAPDHRPIVTSKQIEAFYNDVARGRYKGREAEAAAIEAAINKALVEHRVR